MGKTITTHNGSVANRDHNIRNPKVASKLAHIDGSLSSGNETLIDERPREAYKRIFGEALKEYNDRQPRPERRIKDYYNHIDADVKKHPVYEMIVQVGDKNDTGINAPVERAIIKEFISGWPARNPNLELIGAYIHADERDGTLHAHLDYIPVAHGYKNGMHTQNGLVKALGEQGFDTVKRNKETAQIRWEARENKALEDICNLHGVEVDHPKKQKKHLNTPEYKEYRDEINELERTRDVLKNNLNTLLETAEKASKTVEKEQGDIKHLERQKRGLQSEINALQNKKTILTAAEVNALKGTKTLMGGLKGVEYREYQALKRTASRVERVETERDRALAMVAAANKRVVLAERKADEAMNERPSVMLELRMMKLQEQFERMRNRLKKLINVIPEQLGAIKAAIGNILNDREPFQQERERGFERELER